MRLFLQGISLGVLFATGLLSYVIYVSPPPSDQMTIEEAVGYLEEEGFLVKVKGSETVQDHMPAEQELSEETAVDVPVVHEKEKPVKEYELIIKKDMFSQEVTEVLYQNGIIQDKDDFERFLSKNEHARSIQYGTYNLNDQMTFEEIAEIITMN